MRQAFILPGGYELATRAPALGTFGGAEIQTTRLARLMVDRGQQVFFLCGNPGGAREQTVDGLTVVPTFRLRGGPPVVRFFQMKHDIERALKRVDADVCLQQCASPLTGIGADWARSQGRLFVFLAASDVNVDGGYEAAANLRDRWFYRRGLAKAGGIVAQTTWQAEKIRERLGRIALILPNPIDVPEAPPPPTTPEVVFWAASFQRLKRPHVVVELARRAPDLKFVVAGRIVPGDSYGPEVAERMNAMPNIEFLGSLPHAAMDDWYRRSIALLNTSEYEGFSNTFIEAWRAGAPIVSLRVDPEGIIAREGLGTVTEDLDEVVRELRGLRDDGARRASVALAARRAVLRHSGPRVAEALEAYVTALLAGADDVSAARAAAGVPGSPATCLTPGERPEIISTPRGSRDLRAG